MTLRNYSSTAAETTLSAGVDNSVTTLAVTSTTGFPAAPFVLAVDAGAAAQELVLVTNVAGTNLTVTRAYDSTVAAAHDTGAVVAHSHAAIDFREANTHVNATTGAHGATGAVVGTSDAQALTNKTLALGSNTVSGTKAQFNTALTDGDFATQDGAETLTNKTLASPIITGVGSAAFVRATGATSVTNSTAYAATELTTSVVAGAAYEFHIISYVSYFEGGFNLRLSFPAAATLAPSSGQPTTAAHVFYTGGPTGGSEALAVGVVSGALYVGGPGGSFTVELAQQVSHGNSSTAKVDSFLSLRRIA